MRPSILIFFRAKLEYFYYGSYPGCFQSAGLDFASEKYSRDQALNEIGTHLKRLKNTCGAGAIGAFFGNLIDFFIKFVHNTYIIAAQLSITTNKPCDGLRPPKVIL